MQYNGRQRNKLLYSIIGKSLNTSSYFWTPKRKMLINHKYTTSKVNTLPCIFEYSDRHGKLLPNAGSDETSVTFQSSVVHSLWDVKA